MLILRSSSCKTLLATRFSAAFNLLFRVLPGLLGALIVSVCAAENLPNLSPAQPNPLLDAPEKIRKRVEQALPGVMRQFPAAQADPSRWHTEITLGQFNPNLQLAACSTTEAFLPATGMPWGKIQVGIRCKQAGVKWQVFLPVMVKISGPVLVAARPLSTGEAISADDLQLTTLELSQYPLAQARQLPTQPDAIEAFVTQLMTRPLPAGQPIRQEYVRARPIMSAGDQVRVRMTGQGFAVSAQGKALNQAGAGQTVRVQIESGRILTGVARNHQQVEVSL